MAESVKNELKTQELVGEQIESKQCAGKITRKSMLYKTGVEYGDYCANFVQGCAHGCKYPCYAMGIAKRTGRIKCDDDWCHPYLVANTLELLDKEIPKLKDKIDTVQLCFATDPFMYGYDDVCDMGYKVIKKLNDAGIKCSVLTKGVLPVDKLVGLSKDNVYGITLVSVDEEFRKQYEPGAAHLELRIEALKQLHEAGLKTWVSMEPYPTPNICEQSLSDILNAVTFTDRIVFGRLHYNSKVSEYKGFKQFYNDCAAEVRAFCADHEIDCYIKAKTETKD